ncbi:hypothetical protein BDW22DRAFT_1365265 [Trametopsis cervina]|nr:hypothetical protein BDW22DRAFT_1365265 [Trametopsis cervina]
MNMNARTTPGLTTADTPVVVVVVAVVAVVDVDTTITDPLAPVVPLMTMTTVAVVTMTAVEAAAEEAEAATGITTGATTALPMIVVTTIEGTKHASPRIFKSAIGLQATYLCGSIGSNFDSCCCCLILYAYFNALNMSFVYAAHPGPCRLRTSHPLS